MYIKPAMVTGSAFDSGGRGLFLIASSGGGEKLALRVTQSFSMESDAQVSLAFSSNDPQHPRVRTLVYYIAAPGGSEVSMRCGDTDARPLADPRDLPLGALNAVKADLRSHGSSALNPSDDESGDSSDDAEVAERLRGLTVLAYEVDMYAYDNSDFSEKGTPSAKRSTNDSGRVFTESCALSANSVWQDSGDSGAFTQRGLKPRRCQLVEATFSFSNCSKTSLGV
ncbi:hypothetical protein [Gordonia phthalatica]|uniref:hypothetical protein n=1 Tax=Gordonia phthalatica TaxID=1136941 RepID=UPI0012FE8E77|nr:hypothetical protein [Gordonia phthalatica]